MANIMIDTKLDRVDLVDEGSCSEAYIMMYKGKEGAQSMNKEKVDAILAKMKPEYREVIETYFNDEVEKAKCKKSCDCKEDESCEVCKEAKEFAKAKSDLETVTATLETKETDLAKAKEDLDAANTKIAELEAAEVAKSKGEPDFEEVLKSAPEAMRGFLTQMKAQNDELVAKAKQAAEEKVHNEAVTKAKELSALPVDEAELVEVLKSKNGDKAIAILETVAKSIEDSDLFKEKGAGTNFDNNDGVATIDAKIESLAKSKNISKEKAMIEVFKAEPELYTKYNGGAN